MTVREYIGARYVPVFADPIQWDITLSYEPLTVVMNVGTSYVSRQSVPAGIEVTNTDYWVRWADYNAQLEGYIRQVEAYNARIQANADDIDTINDSLPIADFSALHTVKDAIDALDTAIGALDTAIDARIDVIEANSWVTENRIANDAVTSAKIADGAVTSAKIADGAVSTNDLANGAVTSAKIADGTIANSDIANSAISFAKLDTTVQNNLFDNTSKTIFIGDSYNVGTNSGTNGWGSIVADKLNMTDVINLQLGGAGFDNTTSTAGEYQGMNYTAAITHLASNMSAADRNLVKLVLVQGGWNDYQKANTTANIGAFRNVVETQFPHAHIILVFTLCGSIANTIPRVYDTWERYQNGAKRYALAFAQCFNLPWFIDPASADGTHPNQTAMAYLANWIASVVVGGYQEDYESLFIHGTQRRLVGGSTACNATTINSGTPKNLATATLAYKCIGDMFYLNGVFVQGSNFYPCTMKWAADGTIAINHIQGASGDGTAYYGDMYRDIRHA